MKKILFIVIILCIVVLIGLKVDYKSNYNISIGDSNSYYNYIYYDTRIEDIIDDIENNIYIKNKHIQNILVTSNNIYINLNELYINNKSLYYIEELFKVIRKYSKEKIIVILRKEDNVMDKTLNSLIFNFREKYDIIIKR